MTNKTKEEREYLGDGAYVSFDGYNVQISTYDGMSVTNCILLEPQIFDRLVRFRERAVAEVKRLEALKTCCRDECDAPTEFTFKWQNRAERGICSDHREWLDRISLALGFNVELKEVRE